MPSVEEFVEAIGEVAPSVPQRAMFTALSLAEAEGMSGARVANAGGYESHASARRSFASAGQLIATYMTSGTPSSGATNSTFAQWTPIAVNVMSVREVIA